MIKTKSGFTIVELLIVIVVIGILAAITIVAYNGIQTRARDNARYADVKDILKALELYKIDNGSYPNTDISASNSSCTGNGYSYSWATDGSWMKKLIDGKYLAKAPTPSINDCSRYYRYIKGAATSYGCTTRTTNWYMLEVVGTDGSFTPPDETLNNGNYSWKACPESTPSWGGGVNSWVFAKDDA